ncbi:hypothetical protein JTB14_000117 [Gonioctena quinquepunctata]|nr:hypothetical protein JTB14_000117 [Gonioctena quinquepunctata]
MGKEKGDSSDVKPEIQDDHPSDLVDDENTQLSLDPNLQMYLAQWSQESGCWGTLFPVPFERAAHKSWWDPTFDSEILEEQFRKSTNTRNKMKFRQAPSYPIVIFTTWLSYFVGPLWETKRNWPLVYGLCWY